MSKMSFLSARGLNLSRKSSLSSPSQSNFSASRLFSKQSSSSKNCKSFQANVQEMKQVFDKYDANRDGKISREEYKAMLKAINGNGSIVVNTDTEATQAFQVADKDGDGYIDFKEFMELHKGKVHVKDIQNAFRVFDSDGDGKISAKELMEVLRRIGERHSLESCKKMIREVDSDGDGLIDLNEFTTMMTCTMNLGT